MDTACVIGLVHSHMAILAGQIGTFQVKFVWKVDHSLWIFEWDLLRAGFVTLPALFLVFDLLQVTISTTLFFW